MNNKRKTGMTLFAVGVILLLGSLGADMIGVGVTPGFGLRQIIGSVAGVLVAIVGYVMYSRK